MFGERAIRRARVERQGSAHWLVVDGAPFLAIGGELHNSTSSDPSYFQPMWERLAKSGINTVIASVAWNEVEGVEGDLDFSVVDAMIEGAATHQLRLVLIWFGAYKNAGSTYAPTWVRRDRDRFPRARLGAVRQPTPFSYEDATPRPVLSVFSAELVRADARAFTALMAHVAAHEHGGVVVMVQVENEVGLLGASRDESAAALDAWHGPVPDALRDLAGRSASGLSPDVVALLARARPGESWAHAFGASDTLADEIFMAWGFATYVEQLASAGKRVFDVPYYANAWLGPQPGQDQPGSYPSGGPTGRMIPIWRAAAPSLDFVAPDIYVDHSLGAMSEYASDANPLFVPESRFRAGDMFAAIGRFGALGHCVFGVEDGRVDAEYFKAARTLIALTEQIVTARADGDVFGFVLDDGVLAASHEFGSITVTVRNGPELLRGMLLDVGVELPPPPPAQSDTAVGAVPAPADARPYGVVIRTGPDTFVLAGQGVMFDVSSSEPSVEIDEVCEWRVEGHRLVRGRVLNGDERLHLVPAGTVGVAEIRVLRTS